MTGQDALASMAVVSTWIAIAAVTIAAITAFIAVAWRKRK